MSSVRYHAHVIRKRPKGSLVAFGDEMDVISQVYSSLVTVIEIGTETAVFSQYRIEGKPRFYASLLTVLETEQL